MVLATTIDGGRLVTGPHMAQPTSRQGTLGDVSAEEKLRIVIESIRANHNSREAAQAHGITPEEFRRWRNELLDGAAANMSSPEEPDTSSR